jgi:hypothetical protein
VLTSPDATGLSPQVLVGQTITIVVNSVTDLFKVGEVSFTNDSIASSITNENTVFTLVRVWTITWLAQLWPQLIRFTVTVVVQLVTDLGGLPFVLVANPGLPIYAFWNQVCTYTKATHEFTHVFIDVSITVVIDSITFFRSRHTSGTVVPSVLHSLQTTHPVPSAGSMLVKVVAAGRKSNKSHQAWTIILL